MSESSKRDIRAYTNKKSLVVFLAALVPTAIALCFIKKVPAVAFIGVPVIVAAAFVAERRLF